MVLRRDGGDGGISLFGADLVTEWLARLLRVGEPAAPLAERLERLVLGGARRYTRLEVEKRSGVPRDRTERLWRALGFADVDDDAKVFTDADIEALELIDGLVDSGLIDPTLEAGAARAAGQSLSRLAEWELGEGTGNVWFATACRRWSACIRTSGAATSPPSRRRRSVDPPRWRVTRSSSDSPTSSGTPA